MNFLPVRLLFYCMLLSPSLPAQQQKKIKKCEAVYMAALAYYKPGITKYIVSDSTTSEYVSEKVAADFIDQFVVSDNLKFGSSWQSFFHKIDKRKPFEKKYYLYPFSAMLERMPAVDKALANNMDNNTIPAIQASFNEPQPKRVNLELSNVFSRKNKAIVEIAYSNGLLDGEGMIFLLQKKKGKWGVVAYIQTWGS
jgi:hypothetical protein